MKEITAKIRREGEAALNISDSVRIEASEGAKKLAPFPSATITKVVDFYVNHLLLLQKSVPIRQLVAEYMAEKANDIELSATYRRDLRLRFDRFCRTFGETGTRELTTQEIKEWLWNLKTPDGRPHSPQSKKNFKSRLVALFNYGVQRGWMDTNLCEYIEIKVKGGKKEIYSVDELKAVLAHMDVVALPAFLIGVFAGVRTAERQRMTFEDIDIPRGGVTVKKHKAKTAQASVTSTSSPLPQPRTSSPSPREGRRQIGGTRSARSLTTVNGW